MRRVVWLGLVLAWSVSAHADITRIPWKDKPGHFLCSSDGVTYRPAQEGRCDVLYEEGWRVEVPGVCLREAFAWWQRIPIPVDDYLRQQVATFQQTGSLILDTCTIGTSSGTVLLSPVALQALLTWANTQGWEAVHTIGRTMGECLVRRQTVRFPVDGASPGIVELRCAEW